MAIAADKSKAKALAKGRELAEDLLALHRKHADLFGQMDSLKASLIEVATGLGESIKEVFEKKGTVSVSGSKEARLNGLLPKVTEKFLELAEPKRQKLVADGIIEFSENWSKAYHGRVTVKVF